MKKFVLLICLLGIPMTAFGVEIPTISVSFTIPQKNYRAVLGVDLADIEKTCTQNIIAELKDNFGFMKVGEELNAFKLLIELDNKDRNAPASASQLHEVGFWLTVKDDLDKELADSAYWTFRPLEFYNRGLGTKEAFIAEVSSIFKDTLQKKRDALVLNVLSRIVIAEKAIPVPQNLWWVLPFKKEHLRLELDSEFNIATDVNDQGIILSKKYNTITKGITTEETTLIPSEYRQGMIVTIVKDPNITSNEMNRTEDIKAVKVYIIKYVPSAKEIRADSPQELIIDESGGN
jgi:hypothetical protein